MFRDFVNRAALPALFTGSGAAAVIVNSPKNVFYLSGSPTAVPNIHLTPWYSPSAPSWNWAVVLPDGTSRLFVELGDAAVTDDLAWAPTIVFDRSTTTVVQAVVDFLRDHGMGSAIVGYEAKSMPRAWYQEIRSRLPRVRLTPVDEELDTLRSLKSADEVAAIKRSADILDEAMLRAFSQAKVGDTEWELHASIIAEALDIGAEYCRGGLMVVEESGEPHRNAGARTIQPGDVIFADYATFVGGYPSNQSRHAVVGAPSPEQARMYQITLDVERALIDYMRPGITGQEVILHCRELLARYGIRHNAVMVGHGLGFGYQERPMLTEDETAALRDGNVIAIEPMLPPTQRYTVQDLVLIKEGGNVLLSDRFNTDAMFVIGDGE